MGARLSALSVLYQATYRLDAGKIGLAELLEQTIQPWRGGTLALPFADPIWFSTRSSRFHCNWSFMNSPPMRLNTVR